ncbi:Tannase and feruloyl esterase [Orbilia oligospora]|uniref:Carboxylic ester hydrolase n=1 Tax=Orbilia oligospora TaxID=2813651 RepID=A0A7C8QEP6_ORBOL|nr:Tannase and feruloyl esterase [Orbilia oligospora]
MKSLTYAAFMAVAASSLQYTSATTISNSFQSRCSGLWQNFHPDQQTTVLVAEYLPKGSNFTNPIAHPTCAGGWLSKSILADICRLRLNVSTSSTSSVILEAWMPANWNQKGKRFAMTGNGGLAGCIAFDDLNYISSLGFATVGHNNGHDGDTGVPFFNRPEVVKDFAYRALLTATKVGKKAVEHLYSQNLKKSYFLGCSSGGRQGLKAAQDFPEEYDGIIAGAAGNNWNNLMSSFSYYWKFVANGNNPAILTPEQWVEWRDEAIRQCDKIDGVQDLVIEDPRKCRLRPEARLCPPGKTWSSNKCFTSAQVTFLRKLYEPFYGNNGTFLFPGFGPGDETITSLWFATTPPQYTVDWYRYALLNDENWTVEANFDLDAVDDANRIDPYNISTYKDLSKLKASGHKLLTYHGLADGLLSHEGSDRYYESIVRRMGLPSAKLDSFYRYFPIPGLGHCATGNGAWYIGAANQYTDAPAATIDPEGGVLMSMVKWVEQGIPPERIIGRGFTADGKLASTKNHCKWPLQNTYLRGNPTKQNSWGCS